MRVAALVVDHAACRSDQIVRSVSRIVCGHARRAQVLPRRCGRDHAFAARFRAPEPRDETRIFERGRKPAAAQHEERVEIALQRHRFDTLGPDEDRIRARNPAARGGEQHHVARRGVAGNGRRVVRIGGLERVDESRQLGQRKAIEQHDADRLFPDGVRRGERMRRTIHDLTSRKSEASE
ncbi:hypothetical protein [Paraburkholderia tropica]|uniref:hypothetical protein n=1 Tax=Paraburkholderia tropica TaxID=92647 RepID=UPI002ABE0149|nr:hypothetical protein [Paraburkholderia tropica]